MTEGLGWAIAQDFGIFLAIAFPMALAGLLSYAPTRSVSFLVPAGTLVGGYAYAANYPMLGWLASSVIALAISAGFVFAVSFKLRKLIRWSELQTNFMVATFGIFFMVTNLASILFGDEAFVAAPPSFHHISIGAANIPVNSVLVVGLSAICCAAVFVALRTTGLSLRVRAMSDDLDLVRSLGLDGHTTQIGIFFLSGILAGLAGILLVTESHIVPSMGSIHFLIALPAVLASRGSLVRMTTFLAILAAGRQIVILFLGMAWEPVLPLSMIVLVLLISRLFRGRGR